MKSDTYECWVLIKEEKNTSMQLEVCQEPMWKAFFFTCLNEWITFSKSRLYTNLGNVNTILVKLVGDHSW